VTSPIENLVLRHQLQVALRTNPTPRLRNPDRILWLWFRQLWPSWREHFLIVRPEMVVRWHRKGWRIYWRWRTFLSNQLKGIWAADLLVVHAINYKVLYVLFFIRHDRRGLIHFNMTASPTAAWVWQQLIEATPWGREPKYLIHDRDAVYGRMFGVRLAKLGIAAFEHRSGRHGRTPSASASCAQYARSVWTTRSSSTSDTCMLCSPSTSTTTTLIAHRSLGLKSPPTWAARPAD
jgi:hypothetical protein